MTVERSLVVAIDDDGPTPDELRIYAGLLVSAEQYVAWSGTVSSRFAGISAPDLMEFYFQIVEHWGDTETVQARVDEGDPAETTDGVVLDLLKMVEHELGGRWVKPH